MILKELGTNYPQNKCIHQLFEEQVEKTPDTIAVVFENQQLTYQELNKKANQLAYYLQSLGVEPEVLVGICVERSLELIVGILGILKAGGAYVPLDITYPKERLAFMLSDSQVSILLTQQHLIGKLPEHQTKIVCLDTDWEHIVKTPSQATKIAVKPSNLAYIIYTSGSTGQPKGVLIPHSNVVRLFAATQPWFQFNHNDVWSLFHSYAFDFSVWEIWGALFYGGRLVIISYYVSRSPELFYNLLSQEKITVLNQTPSAFQQLIQLEESLGNNYHSKLNLRFIIFGGEALNIQSLKPWFDRHGDKFPQLVNMYGITETTVHVTYRPINIADLNSLSKVIGRAIPDLQVYILNEHLQPVPVGVTGEIYVEGAGLARGYLNRPELTAEKFISHSINNQPEARLYKTGDLARNLPNGDIEYLGRIDNQVKIRGFRIELGEIETLLNQHPDIKSAKVIVRDDIPGDKRLVAYIIPNLAKQSEMSYQIRDYLKQQLPDYMIPAAFLVLESFPLTNNGKIDYRALPAPNFTFVQSNYVAPRTSTEEILADIWSQVLKVDTIGINDNFFEVGGHSLLATQVISRIRQTFNQEIPIHLFFDFSTIAQFSQHLEITDITNKNLLVPVIEARQQLENLPLSFAQQRLWFLDQLQPNSTAYNLVYSYKIQGLLDIGALETSIANIIERHELLRTNFINIDGQAIQVINDWNKNFNLSVINLQSLPDDEREIKALKIIQQEAERPFNLAKDVLFRVQLVQLSAETYILILNIHHIIFDGWSFGVLFTELSLNYTAYCQGLNSPLTKLDIQYADFTLWQRKWLTGSILELQVNYWKQQLSGIPILELPTDRPRPRVQTYKGATKSFVLSLELTTKLASFAQKEGVTLFMTLLTAFKVLLCRYSGQEDVIVGTPIAGRNRREIEGLMGFFVNTLALRTDLSENPSFRELLLRVRQICLEAYTHQDIPFEQLVELQPVRNLSHTPIFQVMFALQNAPMGELELSNLSVEILEPLVKTAKFDVTLSMEERNGQLIGEWEYNTDLFDDSTVERMLKNFQVLLTGILADSEQNIWKLPLLTEEEQQLLVAWNQNEVEFHNKYIHQLFEEQVEKTPDAVAVVFGNEEITYQELNKKANQVANYLRKLGIGANKLVGLCLEPSLARIIGLLAIFKAGGVYLPLDPVYPQERLRFMIEDSEVSILLTQKSLANKVLIDSLHVVNLDADWLHIATEPTNNLPTCITDNNLAYIIYTSGSTGTPKGVLISHQAITHHCQNVIQHYQLSSSDRILQFASLSFDVSLEQILPTLVVGATLIVVDAKFLTPSEFYHKLIDYGLTVVDVPPVYLTQWLQSLDKKTLSTPINKLRLVICGGEALPPETLKIWHKCSMTGVRLINAYGPTEATITAITFTVPEDITPIKFYTNTPIGRPLPNRKVCILDAHKNLAPIGAVAELYIGGGLAQGYLNRPELTAERFIFHSFNNEPEARLYKTGDLARYLPNGDIEYLGRIDNQVKVRGFRIELGEIEILLNQHPDIKSAKVITKEYIPGDKRLVAYIISDSDKVHQLRDYLKQKLPDYMVPSAFVALESFPLTPNGKIDYHALPIPDFSAVQSNYVAPISHTQKILAKIWRQILKVETIGIHDNFFELGGHSLLATLLISRIRQTFNQEVPLHLLFEYPTISQLSHAISATEQANNSLLLPPIEPRQQHKNLPLSFAQQRLWFFAQLEPNSTAYNMPFKLRLQGILNITALEKSIAEIIQRHEILRTNFISNDGQPIQVINKNIDFKLPIIDLQFLPDDQREIEAEKIAEKKAEKPVNLAEDFLFRVHLLQLSTEKYLLVFNIHHIIFDGWSDDILQRELTALYQAFSTNNALQLPKLSIQYADFALYQHHWFTDEFLESQLVYWKKQLGGALPVLELPMDFPRPQVPMYHQGASHTLSLSSELTASLKSLCQKEGVTLFMTLLAAFKILLSRYSGQEDIIVGTPIAGRNRAEIENLIGFFVNTLALRSDLSGNPCFTELLNRVRQVTLDAYAHQDLPFQKLVEQLKLAKSVSYNPVFQVWFNMINLAQDSFKLNDLTVEPISIFETTSKFDLSLYAEEKNNQIHLRFVYNTLLFNPDTIEWMGTHFQKLLEGICTHPYKTISSFSILTETERYELSHRRQISPTNSFTQFPKPEIEQSIPSRFEQQVKKYPYHIAVKTQNYQWTYKELNAQANKIAQALLEKNNKQEGKIALLLDHDAPMIAAILGVLKAGKTYIPLDPKYPQDRVLYILEDSFAQLILTNHKNLPYAQELVQNKLPIINIDNINTNDSCVEISQEISPDTLAYILYTSGSTGKPKGVIQNHRNVLHFIRNYTNNLHISLDDKLSLFASYSFDAAIIDIFSALLNGATLYPFDIKSEGLAHLLDWLEVNKITIYHSTPTVYRHFIETLNSKESTIKKQLKHVRLVVLGGEQVVKNDVELYQKKFADECIFVNGLGSTESSFNLQYLIDKNIKINQNYVPAGYAFEDTEIILLNNEGKQTDVYGEIAIRSAHIALGYWQKPELTKAVFLDDPQGDKRIYRTGDLGRLRVDGAIECLGRKDFQVKIRGFRIELGEIEAVLNQHPQIKETVVIAREDIIGEKRLVAYIVSRENQNIINEIKQYLEQKLPDYMLPAAIVILDALPLTPNGKINRLALPAPDFSKFKSAVYTAPSDKLELQLTKIWENVLDVRPLGLNDNFFDMGGHSLLAIRLVTQINNALGKNITPNTFFQAPTIKKLADILRQKEFYTSSSSLVPIQPHGSKRPFFYIHTIYGSLIYSLNLLSKLDADQPVYGLQAKGLDGTESPHTCIEDMASHYIKELKTVQPHGPYFLGGWCAGGIIAYEMAQQLYAQGEIVELLTIFDAYPPKMIPEVNKAVNSVSIKIKSSRIHQSMLKLKDIIKRNRSFFSALTPQQQIKSIWQKINHRIRERIKENIYQFYVRMNLTLPRAFLNLAVRDAIAQAYKNYYPKVYPGKVIFFRAIEQTKEHTHYLERWEELAAGGLEIHDIPGHHDTIMSEPHVQVLAEKLKACIKMSYLRCHIEVKIP